MGTGFCPMACMYRYKHLLHVVCILKFQCQGLTGHRNGEEWVGPLRKACLWVCTWTQLCVHLVAEGHGQQLLRSADGDPTATLVHGSSIGADVSCRWCACEDPCDSRNGVMHTCVFCPKMAWVVCLAIFLVTGYRAVCVLCGFSLCNARSRASQRTSSWGMSIAWFAIEASRNNVCV